MTGKHFDFVLYRAMAQLKTESSRAYMGYAWWVLEPLLYLVVFYVVFGMIFARGTPNYIDILITGLVVWKWFDGSIRASMDSIHSNNGLINRVYLPKLVLPAIAVTANTVKFLLILAMLLIFHLWRSGISVQWLWLLILIPLQLLLVLSASLIVASVTPFVPDLRLIFDKLMTLMFFLSGVFYTIDTIPENMQTLFRLNPVFGLINSYRNILIFDSPPAMANLLYVLILSLVALAVGYLMLHRYDRLYPRLNQ